LLAHPANHFRGVASVTVEEMIVGDSSWLDQLLNQHFAKAAGVGDWQPDVFVEMKNFHTGPSDASGFGQSIQKLQLRRGGGCDDARLPARVDRAADGRCCLFGSCLAQRSFVVEYLQQHAGECLSSRGKLYKSRERKSVGMHRGFIA